MGFEAKSATLVGVPRVEAFRIIALAFKAVNAYIIQLDKGKV